MIPTSSGHCGVLLILVQEAIVEKIGLQTGDRDSVWCARAGFQCQFQEILQVQDPVKELGSEIF